MINFFSETEFELDNPGDIRNWIGEVLKAEGYEEGEIGIVFCNDSFLHALNVEFLQHDTLTDIISFDYGMGKQINGEIYISVERVRDNSETFNTDFVTELHRVIIHGILHYCGFKDKGENDASLMRKKEEAALAARSFV